MRRHIFKRTAAGILAAVMLLNTAVTTVYAENTPQESQDAQRIESELNPTEEQTPQAKTKLKEVPVKAPKLGATQEIRTFNIQLTYGAELTGGKYVWNAQTPNEGHKFIYRINYAISGVGEHPANTVKFTIPKHILRNRNNALSDNYEMSLPTEREVAAGEADSNVYYTYKEEGNNIVIYNFKPVSAADNGYIEVAYITDRSTFTYKDMGKSDDFYAVINMNGLTRESAHIPVYINTGATIEAIEKKYPTKFNEWQDSFGAKPANADNYFYLVWELETDINTDITQPYNLKFVDTPSSPNGTVEVVGFQYYGTDGLTKNTTIPNQTITGKRYDKVVTRHSKAQFNSLQSYTIVNNIRAELYPADGIDPMTKVSARKEFNYAKAHFNPPLGWFWGEKDADGVWRYYYDTYGHGFTELEELGMHADEYSNYNLDKFKSGKINYIDDLDYAVWSHGYPYYYTVPAGQDHNNKDNYGKANVRHELTDDNVHFVNDSHKFTSADFQIDTLAYNVTLQEGFFNEETQKFEGTPKKLANTDVVYVYVKQGNNNSWVQAVTHNLGTNTVSSNNTYVKSYSIISENAVKLILQDNIVAYKVVSEGNYFYTRIDTVPNMRLKNSAYVKNYLASMDDAQIVNEGHSDFYSTSGTTLYHKDIAESDFIRVTEQTSSLLKRIVTATNIAKKRQYVIGWKIEQDENYIAGHGERHPITQRGGTFYDLLPIGAMPDESTIAVETPDGYLAENAYTYTFTPNFRDSGRTLLTVTINAKADRYTLYYDTVHAWETIADYGHYVYNPVAYETANDEIAKGFPDNGGEIRDKALFNNLDSRTNAPKFIYADEDYDIANVTAAAAGLTKKIKNQNQTTWSYETETTVNGQYQYRIRYQNSPESKAKNLILFDSLENYTTPSGDVSSFHGTPVGLDLLQIKSKGIAPVVYISTRANLNLENNHNLADTSVWTKLNTVSSASLAPAKAIAIDMRKTTAGSDFILAPNDSLTAVLHMKAPASVGVSGDYPYAYNNIYISDTIIGSDNHQENFFIHQDYTAIRYKIAARFRMHKSNAENASQNVPGIQYRLVGESDYGSHVDMILETSDTGGIDFGEIEKGTYIFSEYKSNDDWLMDYKQHALVVNGSGKVLVDGVDWTDRVYEAKDYPRIHGSIAFIKKKEAVGDGIADTYFRLRGTSDYGTNVSKIEKTDSVGRLVFDNIEKGTYVLEEVQPNTNYVLNKTKWTATIDQAGKGSITEPNRTSDRDRLYQVIYDSDVNYYGVYNEPRYWNIAIRKIDADTLTRPMNNQIWLQGATFRITGVSDLGNNYDKTVITNADGLAEFNNIEKGTYLLKELVSPKNVDQYGKTGTGGTRNYLLDSRNYTLVVDSHGNVTVSGLTNNALGNVEFPNDRALDKKITITKKWIDVDPSKRPTPVLHLSTMEPVHGRNVLRFNSNGGVFTGNKTTNDLIYSDPVIRLNSQKQEIKEQVLTSGTYQAPTRKGYTFTGWYAESSCKTLVSTTGTNISVSGTRNVYAGWREQVAVFTTGGNFNAVLSSVAASGTGLAFKKYTGSSFNPSGKKIVSASNSEAPIYIWKEGNTVYWYSDAMKVYLNQNASNMFSNRSEFSNIDLSGIKSDNTTNLSRLVYCCDNLTSVNVAGLNTSKVTNMERTFYGCEKLKNLNLTSWNTGNVTDMSYMFGYCDALTSLNVSNWNTGKVTNMAGMFSWCKHITSIDVSKWNTGNVTTMERMFEYCDAITSLNVSNWNTGKVTNMKAMFSWCRKLTSLNVSKWNTGNVTDMNAMFDNCTALTSLNVSNWNTGKVTNMKAMFYWCSALTSLDVSKWNTRNVTTMERMFYDCEKLASLNVTNWNTGNVTNMDSMFYRCSKLTSLNVSKWNTSKVTTMMYMFYGCGITSLNATNWNTGNVTNMSGMFYWCQGLTSLNVSKWNTSKVTQMRSMFYQCIKLTSLDLNSWNTSNVTNMYSMFDGCTALTRIYVSNKWNTSKVTESDAMFRGDTKLPNYNANVTNKTRAHYNSGGYLTYKAATASIQEQNAIDKAFEIMQLAYDRAIDVNDMMKQGADAAVKKAAAAGTVMKRGMDTAKEKAVAAAGILKENFAPMTVYAAEYHPAITNTNALRQPLINSRIHLNAQQTINHGNGNYEYISDGNLWVKNGDTWTYTFNVFDDQVKYFLTEETVSGYTADATSYVINGREGQKEATVTNRVATGNLTVRKTVTGLTTSEKFVIEVTLNQITDTRVFGDVMFVNGKATLALGHNETKTITGIPSGVTYTITEVPDERFTTTYSNATGTIAANATRTAVVNNTYIPSVTPPADPPVNITLKKEVAGRYETSGTYQFTAWFEGLEKNKEYRYGAGSGDKFKSMETGNAIVNISLANGQSVTFENIPAGAKYQFKEAAGEYISSYKIVDSEGLGMIEHSAAVNEDVNQEMETSLETADAGEQITITFRNTLNKMQPLHIRKVVNGSADDNNVFYPINIRIMNLVPNAKYDTSIGRFIADNDGNVEKDTSISASQGIDFYGLPVGATYQITEGANELAASYAITAEGTSNIVTASAANEGGNKDLATALETVNENEEATITFTNTRKSDLMLKKLTSNDTTEKFNFTIEFGGTGVPASVKFVKGVPNAPGSEEPYTETEGTATLTDNKMTVQLGKNEYCKVKNLPYSVTYKITEPVNTKYRQYIDNAGTAITEPAGISYEEISAAGNMAEDRDVVYTNKRRDAKLKVQKQVNSIHWSYGDVVSVFKISGTASDGTKHQWVKTLKYPANEFELTVPTGVYKVKEIKTSRYYPIAVAAVAGDVTVDLVNMFAAADLTDGNATVKFTNDFTQREELSHTNSVVNIVPKAE